MAGYVKIWTTVRHNEDFLSLSGLERSVYLQLLIWCKDQRDDGQVIAKSVSEFARTMSISRPSFERIVQKMTTIRLIEVSKNSSGVITIEIPNYKRWQGLTAKEVVKKGRVRCKKRATTKPNQTRPNQTNTTANKSPFEQLRNMYIKICQGFPEPKPIKEWSPKRRGNVNARWKAHSELDWWRAYFERVMASDFLRNGSDSWKADFGWIMLPSNMEKILEGRYDNKKEKRGQLTSEKDYGPEGGRPF